VAGFSTDSRRFREFDPRFGSFQQESGSFEGGKTIAIALFS
jgi:hypothetical protein